MSGGSRKSISEKLIFKQDPQRCEKIKQIIIASMIEVLKNKTRQMIEAKSVKFTLNVQAKINSEISQNLNSRMMVKPGYKEKLAEYTASIASSRNLTEKRRLTTEMKEYKNAQKKQEKILYKNELKAIYRKKANEHFKKNREKNIETLKALSWQLDEKFKDEAFLHNINICIEGIEQKISGVHISNITSINNAHTKVYEAVSKIQGELFGGYNLVPIKFNQFSQNIKKMYDDKEKSDESFHSAPTESPFLDAVNAVVLEQPESKEVQKDDSLESSEEVTIFDDINWNENDDLDATMMDSTNDLEKNFFKEIATQGLLGDASSMIEEKKLVLNENETIGDFKQKFQEAFALQNDVDDFEVRSEIIQLARKTFLLINLGYNKEELLKLIKFEPINDQYVEFNKETRRQALEQAEEDRRVADKDSFNSIDIRDTFQKLLKNPKKYPQEITNQLAKEEKEYQFKQKLLAMCSDIENRSDIKSVTNLINFISQKPLTDKLKGVVGHFSLPELLSFFDDSNQDAQKQDLQDAWRPDLIEKANIGAALQHYELDKLMLLEQGRLFRYNKLLGAGEKQLEALEALDSLGKKLQQAINLKQKLKDVDEKKNEEIAQIHQMARQEEIARQNIEDEKNAIFTALHQNLQQKLQAESDRIRELAELEKVTKQNLEDARVAAIVTEIIQILEKAKELRGLDSAPEVVKPVEQPASGGLFGFGMDMFKKGAKKVVAPLTSMMFGTARPPELTPEQREAAINKMSDNLIKLSNDLPHKLSSICDYNNYKYNNEK